MTHASLIDVGEGVEPDAGRAPCDVVMDGSRSLSSNFLWTLSGQLVYYASQWGIVVMLAKFGDAVLVGQFALALAITAPITMFAGCALRTVQATDTRQTFTFGDYFGFRLVTIVLATVATALAAILTVASTTTRCVILLVGLAKLFELLSDLFYGALQQRERMDRVGQSLMLRGGASLVTTALIAATAWQALGDKLALAVAAGLAVSWGAVFVAFDYWNERRKSIHSLHPRFQVAQLWQLGRLTVPLGLTVLLSALIANVPRYAVEQYINVEALGIYAAIAYFTLAGNMVAMSLANAALPRLSRYWATGARRHFTGLLAVLIGLGLLAGIAAVVVVTLVGDKVLLLAYRAEYARHNDVFVTLTLSMALSFVVWFLDDALYAARRFRIQVPINTAVLVLTIVLSWAWVPTIGLLGAAWVTCVTMFAQVTVRCFVVGWLLIQPQEKDSAQQANLIT